MDKGPSRPPDLPNSFIWLGPDFFEMIDQRSSQFPAGHAFFQSLAPGQVEGIEKLAVDIELQLSGGGVPDSYRSRGFVAGKFRQFELRETPLSSDTVHDLHTIRLSSHSAEQPISPSPGFVHETRLYERV